MMANQIKFCEIHKIQKKALPIQYWCPKCHNEYQTKHRKRNRKNVTSEADPAKRDETIIFD